AVVTRYGVAEVATLLVAVEVFTAEEPAARTLVDVSSKGSEVTDERRGHALRGRDEQRELVLETFAIGDVAQSHRRADAGGVSNTDAGQSTDGCRGAATHEGAT